MVLMSPRSMKKPTDEWREDGADLEWCGSVIGRLVVCKFFRLSEDSPDGRR